MSTYRPSNTKREGFQGAPSEIFSFEIGPVLDSQALTLLGVVLAVALAVGFGVGTAIGTAWPVGWWCVLVGFRAAVDKLADLHRACAMVAQRTCVWRGLPAGLCGSETYATQIQTALKARSEVELSVGRYSG